MSAVFKRDMVKNRNDTVTLRLNSAFNYWEAPVLSTIMTNVQTQTAF